MNQSYFLKNLPAPLQFWVRPMLLISLGLHGLLLAIPMPSEQKAQPPKKEKEPEKVKITQLPTKPPSPRLSPRSSPRPTPRLTPQVRQAPRPIPTPIRRPSSVIPPVSPQTRSIPRPQPQPTPLLSPSPSPRVTPSPSPTPEQAPSPRLSPSPTPEQSPSPTLSPSPSPEQSPSPTPEQSPESTVQNPFADFPFPNNTQLGSLGLLSGETDNAARNTTDGLDQVVSFYNTELPTRKFNSQPINEATDFKVFRVSKEGAEPQFLHLISQQGKTVIVLASQEIKDLSALKSAETRSAEEIAFDSAIEPLKKSEDFGAVDQPILDKLPDPAKFADTNKFRAIVATTMFKPMSPEQLFSEVQNQLIQAGFTQISQEASYGGGATYKVTQGNFTTYLYFVANADNKTIFLVSKDSPF